MYRTSSHKYSPEISTSDFRNSEIYEEINRLVVRIFDGSLRFNGRQELRFPWEEGKGEGTERGERKK